MKLFHKMINNYIIYEDFARIMIETIDIFDTTLVTSL